jgi:hypothetical protein
MSRDDTQTTEAAEPQKLSDILREVDAAGGDDKPDGDDTPETETTAEGEGETGGTEGEGEGDDKKKPAEESYSAIARRAARAKRQAERERAEIAREREALAVERAKLARAEEAERYARALASETSMVKRARLAGIDIEKLAEELGDLRPEELIEERVDRAITERQRREQERAREQAIEYERQQAEAFIAYANTPACADLRSLAADMGWDGQDFVREAARIERVFAARGETFRSFEDLAQAMRRVYRLSAPNGAHADGQRANPAAGQATASKPGHRGASLTTSRTQRGGDLDDEEYRDGERTGAALRRLAGL